MRDKILDELFRSQFITDLIATITSNNPLAEDLKMELFVILLEMDPNRIINAHNNNYLNYMCVNIVKKQYHSSTSPFHTKWRKGEKSEGEYPELAESIDFFDWTIIDHVIWFVDNKLPFVDKELFKLYYKIGRYDRWLGDLRDKSCQKPISSLRKVEKKLAITAIDGKTISIGHDTIRLSLSRSLMRIKHYLKENELLD